MLERALPISDGVDARELFRKLRDRLLWLLRVLGDFIAKGGPLS